MRQIIRSAGKLKLAWLMLACACGGSGYVDLNVRVIIPADIPTMTAGVLRLSLWSYDKFLADAPAMLVDESVAQFRHQSGAQTERMMRVRGDVGSGSRMRHYITVRGFEVTAQGERYVLWDGITGTATPKTVIMRGVTARSESG